MREDSLIDKANNTKQACTSQTRQEVRILVGSTKMRNGLESERFRGPERNDNI